MPLGAHNGTRELQFGRPTGKRHDKAENAFLKPRCVPRKSRSLVIAQSAFEANPLSLSPPATDTDVVSQLLALPARKAQQVAQFLRQNEKLLVVAASTMIMSTSHTALRPVLPVFAKGFGVGAAAVGTTISVYAIARLMMNLPAGLLADEKGRKPLLVWGPAITALGMLGCSSASSFKHLLFWRWVTGLGSALQMAGAQLFLSDISSPSNRARVLGTNQAASLMGGLAGPAIGGVLADTIGIRAPFTFTGIAAAIAALYGFIRLPETHHKNQPSTVVVQQNNIVPANVLSNPIANPVLAATSANSSQISRGSSFDSMQDRRQSQHHASTSREPEEQQAQQHSTRNQQRPSQSSQHKPTSPLFRQQNRGWKELLCNRNFRAIALINAVMFATANGSRSVLMPLLAVQGFKMKTTFLGLIFAGMAVISLVGVMPAAYVADHLGRKWTIVPSSLGLAAALLFMASTGRVEGFLVAAGVWAVSNACIGATPSAYAADVMPKSASGLGLGIYRCAGDLGLMVGPALLGWISDISSVQTAMTVNAAVLIVAVAVFGLTAQETRHAQTA